MKALHRHLLAAGLALACSAAAAQNTAWTFYGGARSGGQFYDDNAGSTVVQFASAGLAGSIRITRPFGAL